METLSNLLKTFAIDYWYKMLMLVSVIFMFVALTMQIHAISNGALLLLAFGGFFIGMGEWINHPYREIVSPDFRYKVFGHVRSARIGGIALDVVGALLVVAAFGKIIWQVFVSA